MNLSLINNQRIIHSLEKEVHALNLILRCKVIKLQFDFSLVVSLFKYLFCCLRYDRLYYFAETKYKTGRNIYKFIASLRFHLSRNLSVCIFLFSMRLWFKKKNIKSSKFYGIKIINFHIIFKNENTFFVPRFSLSLKI